MTSYHGVSLAPNSNEESFETAHRRLGHLGVLARISMHELSTKNAQKCRPGSIRPTSCAVRSVHLGWCCDLVIVMETEVRTWHRFRGHILPSRKPMTLNTMTRWHLTLMICWAIFNGRTIWHLMPQGTRNLTFDGGELWWFTMTMSVYNVTERTIVWCRYRFAQQSIVMRSRLFMMDNTTTMTIV